MLNLQQQFEKEQILFQQQNKENDYNIDKFIDWLDGDMYKSNGKINWWWVAWNIGKIVFRLIAAKVFIKDNVIR